MMHDACHGMLFSNRRLNDLIGDIFVAYPLGFSIDLYRANHMYHHRYTNTLRDRDYRVQRRDSDQHFPKSGAAMAWLLGRRVTGLNFHPMDRDSRIWAPFAHRSEERRVGTEWVRTGISRAPA